MLFYSEVTAVFHELERGVILTILSIAVSELC
jgi:hypothetical protein